MIKVLILVCNLALHPTHSTCQPGAEGVEPYPGPDADTIVQCGLYGQTYLAEQHVGRRIDLTKEYVKVRCSWGGPAAGNVG